MAAEIMDRGDSTFVVTFDDECVLATVTSSGDEVAAWLATIQRIHRRRLRRLVVGLDAEWLPQRQRGGRNPVAVLQLCVGRRCLLFQICHADYLPNALFDFLADDRFTFVGVGVSADAENLLDDYDLLVRRPVELGPMAVEETGRTELRRAGLVTLARAVMGTELQKPKWVTLSRWDCEWLSLEQVKYACIDAFVSFEIGRRLIAGEF